MLFIQVVFSVVYVVKSLAGMQNSFRPGGRFIKFLVRLLRRIVTLSSYLCVDLFISSLIEIIWWSWTMLQFEHILELEPLLYQCWVGYDCSSKAPAQYLLSSRDRWICLGSEATLMIINLFFFWFQLFKGSACI